MSKFIGELYHGTDLNSLMLSKEQRSQMAKVMYTASEILYSRFIDDGYSVFHSEIYHAKYKEFSDDSLWRRFIDSMLVFDSRIKGSHYYEYDAVYLTNSKIQAASYARRSFLLGEQGYVTKSLYDTARRIWGSDIGSSPDENSFFRRFGENTDPYKPKPGIIILDDVEIESLSLENGSDLSGLMGLIYDSSTQVGLRWNVDYEVDLKKYRYEVLPELSEKIDDKN